MSEPDWQRTTKRGVEAHALRYNKLHATVQNFLQPLFEDTLDLSTVRIIVYPKKTSYLGTAVWVMGDKIVFEQGTFNAEHAQWEVDNEAPRRYVSNKVIDLATINGMSVLCHELRHVWQSRTLPWWKQWWRFGWGIMKSIFREGKLYSHNQVWQEQDAIEFQLGPADTYIRSRRENLHVFALIR